MPNHKGFPISSDMCASPPKDEKGICLSPGVRGGFPLRNRREKEVVCQEGLPLPPFTFQKKKGVKCFAVSAGHGDSAALREITRRWPFHGTRRSLRPSAFLCGIPFGFNDESVDPGRCFRKAHRHPRAQSKLSLQEKIPKVKGGKGLPGANSVGNYSVDPRNKFCYLSIVISRRYANNPTT